MATGTDATYAQTSNYNEQGGSRLVIGGELDVVSGGNIDVESGGYVAFAAGGYQTVPVTAGTTAANFAHFGHTTFGSTAAKSYTLDAPVAGVVKTLRCTAGATGALQTVQSGSTAITFDGTKTNLVFNAADDAVVLVGESATRWAVVANVGSVAIST